MYWLKISQVSEKYKLIDSSTSMNLKQYKYKEIHTKSLHSNTAVNTKGKDFQSIVNQIKKQSNRKDMKTKA